MHYCIFNGYDSRDLGLMLESCPPRAAPKRRGEALTVPGRSGSLFIDEGAYESYIRQAQFTLLDLSKLDQVCAAFQGSGWLTFDDEPNFKNFARVANQISFEQVALTLRKFPVEFECQPFKYERSPQELAYHLSQGYALETYLHNPGTVAAAPLIKVSAGNSFVTVTAAGRSFKVRMGSGIVVDCDLQECYHPSLGGNLNRDMTGDFIALPPGECHLTIEPEGSAAITIQPRWRWL